MHVHQAEHRIQVLLVVQCAGCVGRAVYQLAHETTHQRRRPYDVEATVDHLIASLTHAEQIETLFLHPCHPRPQRGHEGWEELDVRVRLDHKLAASQCALTVPH